MRALGDFEPEQPFHGQAVRQVIAQRVQVIDAVGEGNRLRIVLSSHDSRCRMQIAHVWNGFDDILAIQFEQIRIRRASTGAAVPC